MGIPISFFLLLETKRPSGPHHSALLVGWLVILIHQDVKPLFLGRGDNIIISDPETI